MNLSKQIEFDSEHPLNFHFWSDLLKKSSMLERDLFWSEYIRNNHSWYGNSYFRDFVLDFERICKEKKILSDRIHIAAKKIMWIFSTNIRILRDEATRALYYYARKYPKEFLDLLKYSTIFFLENASFFVTNSQNHIAQNRNTESVNKSQWETFPEIFLKIRQNNL